MTININPPKDRWILARVKTSQYKITTLKYDNEINRFVSIDGFPWNFDVWSEIPNNFKDLFASPNLQKSELRSNSNQGD